MAHENIEFTISEINQQRWANIKLKGNLTLSVVPDIAGQLNDIVNEYDNLEIVVDNLSGIDLSFIQMLHAVRKTLDNLSKNYTLNININDDIRSIVKDAGFNANLCVL